jgi:hypothetical protein
VKRTSETSVLRWILLVLEIREWCKGLGFTPSPNSPDFANVLRQIH